MRSRIPVVLGNLLVLAGFGAIAVAWRGGAALEVAQDRVGYALTGGAGGLALIVVGMALVAVQAIGAGAARRARDMAGVQEQADALRGAAIGSRPGPRIAERPVEDRRAGGPPAPPEAAGPSGDDSVWAPATPSAASSARADFERALPHIDGLDASVRRSLYINFGTVAALRSASAAEIARVTGIPQERAERLLAALR